MTVETWYVLEDGTVANPNECELDESGTGYLTRELGGSGSFDHDGDGQSGGSSKPGDAAGDLAALRSEYHKAFDKKPFPGWDAATLREKIAAKSKAD